jgi:acetyl esterase
MSTVADRRIMQLDPGILDFLKGLEAQGGPPLSTLSPAEARLVLVTLQRSVNVTKLPVDSEDRTIGGGPTGEISLRIMRPQGKSGALPGVMYFHGGGWILGDKETGGLPFKCSWAVE